MNEYLDVYSEALFVKADELIDEKKFEEAVFILQSLMNRNPPFGKAFNHMGWFYQWKVKDFVKAEECYKKAMELRPDYWAAYSNYLSVLVALQRWNDLEAFVEKAAKVPNANLVSLYKDLGMAQERLGKYEQAIETYKKSAMDATDNSKFDEALKSIERCKEKMRVLR